MPSSQIEQQRPVHDHALLTSLRAHVFSMDYLYFIPAILVSLFWTLLPIPDLATLYLFIWSLPLFTAGAVSALHKEPAPLFKLIYSRCPMQGVFLLGYALAAIAGFFIVLFLADNLGWIGVAGGEILTALLMVAGTAALLVRIWPDYLLRVIHPQPGQGNSWIGVDFPYGLGPSVFTAWKYSARAKLPLLTITSALVSLFVVVSGVLFLHTDIFPGREKFHFIGNIVTLFLFYPVAHLILVRAGCRLLSANFIPVVPAAENTSRPPVSSLTVSPVANQSQFFDKNATVDKRVFACVNRNEVEIITGWLTENNNRKENMVVLYNRNRNLVQLIGGPWLTGHWGHETYGTEVSLDDAFSGIYPRGFHVKDEYVELIKQYLLKNVKKTATHTGLSV